MDTALRVLELVGGALVLFIVLNDVFNAVLVPRPTTHANLISRNFVRRLGNVWRWAARRAPNGIREMMLGIFAPGMIVIILAMWIAGEIVGYGLIYHALRVDFQPQPDFPGALYIAGGSLTSLGQAAFTPLGGLARGLTILTTMTGLGTVALTFAYVFSLFGHFQTREALVVSLDSRAGAPPSGVTILETYSRLGIVTDLDQLFYSWERWAAEVLNTHLAYPILIFFRSSHDNESWVSALGAVLDAATLMLTCVQTPRVGQAAVMFGVGDHLVEDLAQRFGFPDTDDPGVERAEFDDAMDRLAQAGYRLAPSDEAWDHFSHKRAGYASQLNALALFLQSPPAQWIGDRSILGYRRRHRPAA